MKHLFHLGLIQQKKSEANKHLTNKDDKLKEGKMLLFLKKSSEAVRGDISKDLAM